MRHINSFCHFFPKQIFDLLSGTTGGTTDIGKRIQGVRTIHDLDARLRMMDEFEDYSQIISLGLPPLEGMAGPDRTPEFARVANDGLAELCEKHPDRFVGFVGALPMDVPEAAIREAERILIHGKANGLQLHTNVNGACLDEPRFLPIFEIAAEIEQADPAASGTQAGLPGLRRGEDFEIRNLDDLRLALRDQRDHGAPGFFRRHDAISEAQDFDPSPGRDDPVLRRAHGNGLGHAGQPDVRGGL